uniref:ATP synthase F(1) complex subunit gamma, mitochondrial n=1 Tax=Seriola lalandi dorsalis TaxID=1841481 RepID=A0A3B4WVA0_SERLL
MLSFLLTTLRDRVGSVKNTKKITSAMRLVAAAKVRRAQERLSTEALDIPLLQQREAKKVGLLVITGDRGLCGSYNSAAIKKTEGRIAELKAQGVEAELITVGNKGSTYFKRRSDPSSPQYAAPLRKAVPCGQAPTAEMATELASELLSSYYAGELDRVELIYTSFVSMISSIPSVRTMIPLTPQGIETEGDEIFKMTTKDGDFESVASELASRMTAMQSATDNAKELQKTLELQMNRARQAKITQELMEIIAGADSV